jgi:cytochrome c553
MSVFATLEFGFMKFLLPIVCSLMLISSGSAYADKAAGQSAYSAKGCIGCHGAGGKSTVPTYPSLAGKNADFVRQNLTDFRSGARKNPTMNAMAAGLSDVDIENLAIYIDSLK